MPILILFFILQATHEHLYKYTAKEEYFGEENTETFEMTIHFRVFCLSGEEIWINSTCELLAQLVLKNSSGMCPIQGNCLFLEKELF